VRSVVDCLITTSGGAPLIVDGFRRVRRSTFTGGAIMERAEYDRHSRARMAETAKDASRHATPDAPERIDHRRRCTRHDHRTCCRGSCGSASTERVPTAQCAVARSRNVRVCFGRAQGIKQAPNPSRCSTSEYGLMHNSNFRWPRRPADVRSTRKTSIAPCAYDS
jgi:hypothetical protein